VDVQRALKGAAFDLPKTVIDGEYGQFNSYTKDNGFTVSQSLHSLRFILTGISLPMPQIKTSEWQHKVARLELATQVNRFTGNTFTLLQNKNYSTIRTGLYSGFLRAAELRARAGETTGLEMITARSQSLEIKNQFTR